MKKFVIDKYLFLLKAEFPTPLTTPYFFRLFTPLPVF